ncbi:MAG: hypothetical protein DHS20C11_02330 [Lysobacteraceae bacterium]|nr:MAG: hypothetical protein DHS20C11_02330 [Xanthomonadaceae bacterium]
MVDISSYALTVWSMGAMAALMLVQALVADFAGIRVAHKPGSPVQADPESFLFRATRTQANTNETIAVFILLAIVGMLAGAAPVWFNYAALGFVVTRLVYATAYYANWPLFRSITFGISLAMLAAMLLACIRVWLF